MRSVIGRVVVTGLATALVGWALSLLYLLGDDRPGWDLLAYLAYTWAVMLVATLIVDQVAGVAKDQPDPKRRLYRWLDVALGPDTRVGRVLDRVSRPIDVFTAALKRSAARLTRPVTTRLERTADELESRLGESLDRCNDTVQDFILDGLPRSETALTAVSPDDDTPLPPLDRDRLVGQLKPQFLQAFREVVRTVEQARTVRELAAYNVQVTEILAKLQGEILAEVLREADLARRVEVVSGLTVAPNHAPPPEPAPERTARRRVPRFPGSWVRMYRRMRAKR
jgi:hypothetical protein